MNTLKTMVMSAAMALAGGVTAQTTYTFTNCGATGQDGPSAAEVTAEYMGTSLEGLVTETGGIQFWTVPVTGDYSIEVFGAEGGDDGGLGARMYGEFFLTAGDEIQILVGQMGGTADGLHGSGGGGSFVVATTGTTPLIIAGGGGGHGKGSPGISTEADGSDLEPGQSPPLSGGPGGVDGGGGAAASGATGGTATTPGADAGGSTWASGGGGLLTNGGGANSGTTPGGQAFVNGGQGGDAASGANTPGGFGGGGGAGDRGAGAGGYCGGGAGTNNNDSGGGGGSFNSGVNQDNEAGNNSGHGMVIITQLCIPLTTSVSSTTICQFDELTLGAESTLGGTVTWDMGVENDVPFQVTDAGTIIYTATSDDALDCEFSVEVLVEEAPEISLTATDVLAGGDGAVYTTLEGGIFPFTYDWDNDGTGDFDDDQNITGLDAGWYTVTVMHGNGCTYTDSAEVSSQLGIEDEVELLTSVYPNPTTDRVTVAYPGQFNYVVTNILGEEVFRGNGTTQVELSFEEFEAGAYLISVTSEGRTETVQLVKN
ncbi:MAG: T9SS type A sorting domain-containing protein [Flavobacteriales bacterium]|nr:T9SS type A sorting domain-containing protein [Flavobacteriales bacterium]